MSRRQRQRANARPWNTPTESAIPWDAIAADQARRQPVQPQPPKAPQ